MGLDQYIYFKRKITDPIKVFVRKKHLTTLLR